MLNKFCQWLESNRGPLVSKATALPTEPQPLPYNDHLVSDRTMPKSFAITLVQIRGLSYKHGAIVIQEDSTGLELWWLETNPLYDYLHL